MAKILVSTAEGIPGMKIVEILGVVKGNTVRTRNLGVDIGAGLKTLIGGEVKNYTTMMAQSRDEAFNRMVNKAIEMGADAVIGMRFMTAMIMKGSSEMLAYETAVKLR